MDINEGYKVEKFFNDEISPVLEHLRWLLETADIPYAFIAQVGTRSFEHVVSIPSKGYRKFRFEVDDTPQASITVYPKRGKKYTAAQEPTHIKPWFPKE